MKKTGLLFLFMLIVWSLQAQNNQPNLDSLLSRSLFDKGMELSVQVKVEVPGINMPDKMVQVSIDKEGKAKIRGEGLLLLPQKGIFGQYEEFMNTANQVIFLQKNADTLSYKIVSLDSKSDWITADVYIDQPNKRLSRMEVTTRKYGTFNAHHYYSSNWYPDSTQVRFRALPIELPMKFMGHSSQDGLDLKKGEELTGLIVLSYFDVRVTKD